MIAWIEGEVILAKDPVIIKTNQGIGYEVYMVDATYDLVHENSMQALYVHAHTKDEQLTHYGFKTWEARALFVQLISVSGVGPKIAMLIMRSRSMEEVSRAISIQDLDFFSQVKGLGKKTASKILLMLQDKVLPVKESLTSVAPVAYIQNSDAKMALIKLGFHPNKVADVLSRMEVDGQSTSVLIRQALAELSE